MDFNILKLDQAKTVRNTVFGVYYTNLFPKKKSVQLAGCFTKYLISTILKGKKPIKAYLTGANNLYRKSSCDRNCVLPH
ncbi:hypothetical protein IMPR6_90078 [Imperialibacter sp. EC-SDR9]|nr:hypothetical protein IMPERIA75_400078 [Imperialibacter sp. 75]CAD5288328.1 hypothetical protein IMPERIA89_580078 [Imperialibacter sp. 89]VVT35609.1 hypothetical protein IMPR6_90078 [Imperialibacter sp. EC-SDR9]